MTDCTLVMPALQLAALRLETASPRTLCIVVGEMLSKREALEAIPKKVLSRLNEKQLTDVVQELIGQAKELLSSSQPIRHDVVEALRCGALGVTLMGSEGSNSFHSQHNALLELLVEVDKTVNFS